MSVRLILLLGAVALGIYLLSQYMNGPSASQIDPAAPPGVVIKQIPSAVYVDNRKINDTSPIVGAQRVNARKWQYKLHGGAISNWYSESDTAPPLARV